MNKFKITPKIALIIVLVLITIAGIAVYFAYNKKTQSSPAVSDSGFLSFFGGRKVKPNDESTIPGVIPNQDGNTGGLTGGLTAGGDTSGDTSGGNTAGNNQNGKLTLRPIGNGNLSLNDNNGGNTNVNGGSGGSGGSNTGGGSAGGNTAGGNTGSNTGGNGIPQIDCTPPTLPYTQPQIEELKELTARFYRISANLHTASDVQNEIDTQKSYYDLYTQATGYTKQCYKELADPANKNKAQNASAKSHPYITDKVLQLIRKYDPRVIIAEKTDVTKINNEIASLNDKLAIANSQIYFLENLSSKTDAQNLKLAALKEDIKRYASDIDYKKNQKWAFQNTKLVLMYYETLGSFFEEENKYTLPTSYKTDTYNNILELKVARPNTNSRYNKIWAYTAKIIEDRGQQTQVIRDMWTVGSEYYNYNPLKPLAQDKLDPSLNDAPNSVNGESQSWVNRFRLIETALRVW